MGDAKGFGKKVSVNGQSAESLLSYEVLYLPDPERLPDGIKVDSYLKLIGSLSGATGTEIKKLREESKDIASRRLMDLPRIDQVKLLLKISRMKKFKVVIMNDFLLEIESNDAEGICTDLKTSGHLIIELKANYLTLNYFKFDKFSCIFLEQGIYNEENLGERRTE